MSKREYKRGPRAFLSGIALTIVAVVCVCLVLQAKKHTEEIIALNDAKDESVPAIFRQVVVIIQADFANCHNLWLR